MKNPGVEERRLRDVVQSQHSEAEDYAHSYAVMEKKAALYEKLSRLITLT